MSPLARFADRAENSIMQTISVAVSAILIAAGLVTAPGLIITARDNNAKADLANAAYAESAAIANGGTALIYDNSKQTVRGLEAVTVGDTARLRFLPSDGVRVVVDVSDDGQSWVAAARANGSTSVWLRSSSSATVTEGTAANLGAAAAGGLPVAAALPSLPAGMNARVPVALALALGGYGTLGCAQSDYDFQHRPTGSTGLFPTSLSIPTRSAADITRLGYSAAGTGAASATYAIPASSSCNGATAAASTAPQLMSVAALPAAVANQDYSTTVTASGSPAPAVKVDSTTLPPGMSASGGTIAGRPTTTGLYNVAVSATNSFNTDTAVYPLAVTGTAPSFTGTFTGTSGAAAVTVNTAFTGTFAASGNPAPGLSATLADGSALPGWLTFDSSTGGLTGTPPASAGASAVAVRVRASNSVGDAFYTLTLNVAAIAPTVNAASLPSALVGADYGAQQLTAANATGAVTWARSSGALPAGLSLGSDGRITGTPTGSYGASTFGVTATAAGKTSAERVLTIAVAQTLSGSAVANADADSGNGSNWAKSNTNDGSDATSVGINAVNFPRQAGNWAEHTKTINNQGSFQGITYCAPTTVPAGTRVRYSIWIATGNSQSNAAYGNGTGIAAFASATNGGTRYGAASGTVPNDASGSSGTYRQLSGDYTTAAAGAVCVTGGVQLGSAQDYFRDVYADSVAITVGG